MLWEEMMKQTTTTITCDTCKKDISPRVSGYPAEYILHVKAMNVAQSSGAVYAVLCYPPIDNDLYFCGLGCMRGYK